MAAGGGITLDTECRQGRLLVATKSYLHVLYSHAGRIFLNYKISMSFFLYMFPREFYEFNKRAVEKII